MSGRTRKQEVRNHTPTRFGVAVGGVLVHGLALGRLRARDVGGDEGELEVGAEVVLGHGDDEGVGVHGGQLEGGVGEGWRLEEVGWVGDEYTADCKCSAGKGYREGG